MSKRDSIPIHLELIQDEGTGFYGFTYSMEGCGGAGSTKSPLPEDALAKAMRFLRKELRRLMETKEEKTARLDKAKRTAALRKSKDKGTL